MFPFSYSLGLVFPCHRRSPIFVDAFPRPAGCNDSGDIVIGQHVLVLAGFEFAAGINEQHFLSVLLLRKIRIVAEMPVP